MNQACVTILVLYIRTIKLKRPLALAGFYARISRNFRQGGGGPGQSNKTLTMFFFCCFSPQLILQKPNGQFQSNLSFQGSRGGPTYSRGGGGGNFFQGNF